MRVLPFLIIIIAVTACGSSEKNEPWEYIEFISQPWDGKPQVEVELINFASHTAYQTITVLVVYHDEGGKRIGTERIMHYEILEPNSNSVIKSTIHPPPLPLRTHTISFEVEQAYPVDRSEFF